MGKFEMLFSWVCVISALLVQSEAFRVGRVAVGVRQAMPFRSFRNLRCQPVAVADPVIVLLPSKSSLQQVKEQIPNALTVSRLLAVPLFMSFFVSNQRTSAFTVFVLSSVTDWLDGYLARRWGVSTPFGAFLDPVADKLMVATALIFVTFQFPTPAVALPTAIILCREIGISALREWMATQGLRDTVAVGKMGKIKTVLQMTSLSLLLLVIPPLAVDGRMVGSRILAAGLLGLYGCTAAAVISGWQYLAAARRALKERDGGGQAVYTTDAVSQ